MSDWNTKDYPHSYIKDGTRFLSITKSHPIYISFEGGELNHSGDYHTEEILGLWEEFEFKFSPRKRASPVISAFRKKR